MRLGSPINEEQLPATKLIKIIFLMKIIISVCFFTIG